MRHSRFPWKNGYLSVEPGINADGVRIYPFDPSFPVDVGFITVSGRRHARMNRPQSEVRLISLNFQADILRGGEREGEEEPYFTPFVCQDSEFPHVIPASRVLPREALQLMLRVHAELPAATRLKRLAVKTYMKMLLLLLLKFYTHYLGTRDIVERKQRDIQRLQPLFRLLEQRYGEHIEVTDAARACAMSSSHFMRFFKQTTGQSFRSYLTSFRIAKAQLMLSHSDKPIAEISERVAFCSQSYFGEVFRTLVGMTPLAYRRRLGATGAAVLPQAVPIRRV